MPIIRTGEHWTGLQGCRSFVRAVQTRWPAKGGADYSYACAVGKENRPGGRLGGADYSYRSGKFCAARGARQSDGYNDTFRNGWSAVIEVEAAFD